MTPPRHLPFTLFRHVVLAAGAIIMLAPFIWLLSLAMKPADEIFTTDIHLLPRRWDAVRNFTVAFEKVPL
ncbi:MAG TPA: carbohydrate ABC transporter permease, partial [Reyranella sp.]|nr:carbohydrate ABC transporter permease [Reyranella sp.]